MYKVVECADGCRVDEHGEGIALAGRVALGDEEGLHEFRGVWDEMFVLLVDLHDCKDCILADERVAMFLSNKDAM